MSIIYPSKRQIEGPWLINQDALQELDEIILNINKQLIEVHKDFTKDYYPYNQSNLSVTVIFEKDKKVKGNCIKEIIQNPEIKELTPNSLNIIVNVYPAIIKFNIECNKSYFQNLKYTIEFSDGNYENIKYNIKFKLDEWIDKYKPNNLLIFWRKIHYWLVPSMGFILALVLSSLENTEKHYKNGFKKEAYNLIKEGINDTNRNKAIELLLKLNSDYIPYNNVSEEFIIARNKSILIIIIIFIIVLILLFCPKANIAIGKGKRKVEFWKKYLRFVFYTIPILIIIPIIVNIISKLSIF